MEDNLQWSGICCDYDQLGDGSVQGLGGLIGSFFYLLQAGALGH